MKKVKIKNKGSALAYALVILSIVTIVLVSMLGYISSQLKFSANRVEREKAFQIAESGIYYYRWYLAHNTSGKTVQAINDFWDSGTALGVASPFEADYDRVGKYKIEVTPPEAGSTVAIVKSTGWTYKSPGVSRTIQVRFRRPSWSEYMFLVNGFINFGDEATVYGKVHSNFGIRFDGVAYDTVSALPASFDDPSHGGKDLDFGVHTHTVTADPAAPDEYPWPVGTIIPNHPDTFKGGREFPVKEVNFNGVLSDLAEMKKKSASCGGKYFDSTGEGRRIILKNDGSFDICTVDDFHHTSHEINKYLQNDGTGTCNSCSDECLSNYAIPNNGIIFVENNAWVEGSIDGKRVTIVAANLSGGTQADLYIGMDNLRYANYDCENMVGLVGQKDITVIRKCPNNLTIDAALLAQTGRVGINDNGFSSKTSITFNGAIASYLQPYFQSGVSGFAVRFYNFNKSLLYCPPPYFPTGTEYSIDLWEEL